MCDQGYKYKHKYETDPMPNDLTNKQGKWNHNNIH
jgi:hypothetical protein